MSDPPLYGLCELARELHIPESTARYYRDVFAAHVPSVGLGRRRRYPDQAVTVLRFIADAFAVGHTREEIAAALSNGSVGVTDDPPIPRSTLHLSLPPDVTPQAATIPADDAREQRELMWQMIRELSRFGDAIERQHYILSELVEHVFHSADRRLPAAEEDVETVDEADVVLAPEVEEEPQLVGIPQHTASDLEALRKALESERKLVDKLRESKLSLERRAAAAEAELEEGSDRSAGLLRRLFEKGRSKQVQP